jgi:hypothetical protein
LYRFLCAELSAESASSEAYLRANGASSKRFSKPRLSPENICKLNNLAQNRSVAIVSLG